MAAGITTLSDALIPISFALCLVIFWSYRGAVLGFVTKRTLSVRDEVNAAQRQRLEALMRLKQIRARNGVMVASGEKLLAKATGDADAMRLSADARVEKLLSVSEERAVLIGKRKHKGAIMNYRSRAVEVAVRVAELLLERDKDALNSQNNIRNIVGEK